MGNYISEHIRLERSMFQNNAAVIHEISYIYIHMHIYYITFQ